METQHIVGAQGSQQILVSGGGPQRLERRERHMQEEADRVIDTRIAQLGRQRYQVIVVHPDHVVRAQ